MKSAHCIVLLALLTAGCGMPPAPVAPAPPPSLPPVVAAGEIARRGALNDLTGAIDRDDEQLERLESRALHALKVALGQAPAMPGTPMPESSSTALKALKKGKVKVRLEPVVDGDGKALSDDLFQMKDSYTDRLTSLQRKLVEKTATPKENKEIRAGMKYMMKLSDLRTSVLGISQQVMQTNIQVQQMSLTSIEHVAKIVAARKRMGAELDAEDFAVIRRRLEQENRGGTIAASLLAMMATYEAAFNDGGDPKAIDIVAEGTLKAFPVKADVTDETAKRYVADLAGKAKDLKPRYEAHMRAVFGDKTYERGFKAKTDEIFASAETAQKTAKIESAPDPYTIAVAKCSRGDIVDSGLGARCRKVYQAAQSGDASQLYPAEKQALGLAANVTIPSEKAPPSSPSPSTSASLLPLPSALPALNAGSVTDVALGAAGKFLPNDGMIGASLQGIAALRKGDAKGAINAALSFVPVPGLKDAFGIASKLLFSGS